MKFDIVKYLGMVIAAAGISFLAAPMAQAGSYLGEMRVPDTCGTEYADKLATCTPFRCAKPSPMLMIFGITEDQIKQMPPEQQKQARKAIVAAEKKVMAMSPQERAAMKAEMTTTMEIKGRNAQGLCQTETGVAIDTLMRCAYDPPMLKRVSAYHKIVDMAEDVESESRSSGKVNGKYVNTITTKVNGKVIDDPSAEVLQDGTCKMLMKDADRGWGSIDQLNQMAHINLNLLEHGKHVAGHVRVLNAANGKAVFDKDVTTDKEMRKINLDPGTYDIEISSKNPELPPVWKRGIKLGKGNVFEKNIEFYAITGTLKLTVNVNGQPANMAVYMHEAETHQWLVLTASTFGEKPSFYFKSSSIKLPETLTGKYEVFVTPITGRGFEPPANAKYKKFLLTIRNGDKVEKTIDFASN